MNRHHEGMRDTCPGCAPDRDSKGIIRWAHMLKDEHHRLMDEEK